MANKNLIPILILCTLILFSFFGCKSDAVNHTETDYNISEEIKNDKKYKYINGYASFVESYENGYIVFKDSNFSSEDDYYGKLRWKDESEENKIVSAYQIIDVNGKAIYSEPLKIEFAEDSTDTWNYMDKYS